MERENISADGIRRAAKEGTTQRASLPAPLDWVHARMRDTHDLWHAAVGYSGDVLGEVALLAFILAQTWNPAIALILAVGLGKTVRFPSGGAAARATILDGFRRGFRAQWLPAQDWEAMLALPVEEVRRRLGLEAPPVYDEDSVQRRAAEGSLRPGARNRSSTRPTPMVVGSPASALLVNATLARALGHGPPKCHSYRGCHPTSTARRGETTNPRWRQARGNRLPRCLSSGSPPDGARSSPSRSLVEPHHHQLSRGRHSRGPGRRPVSAGGYIPDDVGAIDAHLAEVGRRDDEHVADHLRVDVAEKSDGAGRIEGLYRDGVLPEVPRVPARHVGREHVVRESVLVPERRRAPGPLTTARQTGRIPCNDVDRRVHGHTGLLGRVLRAGNNAAARQRLPTAREERLCRRFLAPTGAPSSGDTADCVRVAGEAGTGPPMRKKAETEGRGGHRDVFQVLATCADRKAKRGPKLVAFARAFGTPPSARFASLRERSAFCRYETGAVAASCTMSGTSAGTMNPPALPWSRPPSPRLRNRRGSDRAMKAAKRTGAWFGRRASR